MTSLLRSLVAVSVLPLLSACIVLPGRTAGETWGGAWSARFAPPEEKKDGDKKKDGEKKDEKKEEKKDGEKEAKAEPPPTPGPHDRPGYLTRMVKDRLWVLRKGSKDLAEFLKKGESAKSVTILGAGPDGMTMRAPDAETIRGWQLAIPGYETYVVDGRLWVLPEGGKDAAEFAKAGELAKSITLVGRGPEGMSVRAPDTATAEAYLSALPAAGR